MNLIDSIHRNIPSLKKAEIAGVLFLIKDLFLVKPSWLLFEVELCVLLACSSFFRISKGKETFLPYKSLFTF